MQNAEVRPPVSESTQNPSVISVFSVALFAGRWICSAGAVEPVRVRFLYFPLPRMRNMTCERLALVKTPRSVNHRFAVVDRILTRPRIAAAIRRQGIGSLRAADKAVVTPQPVGVEKIRRAGLALGPQSQFRPVLAVRALITTARSAGENSARRHKH